VTREDVGRVTGALPLHSPVPSEFFDSQLEASMTIPKHVWHRVLDGLITAPPPILSGRINVPALVLWGGADDVLQRAQADELVAAIEQSRLVVYEGTGHLVLWEQPELVARDTIEFIRRTSGGPRSR
jgi:rifampin ADP-ribosylating transferase